MHRYNRSKKSHDRWENRAGGRHGSGPHEPEQRSRLFRGVQEFRVKNSRQELNQISYQSNRPQGSPSSMPVGDQGDRRVEYFSSERVEYFSNERTMQSQYNTIAEETTGTAQQNIRGLPEEVQDDATAVLERARALVAASDPVVQATPPTSQRNDGSTRENFDQRKWPSTPRGPLEVSSLSPSLDMPGGSHQESYSVHSSNIGVQSFRTRDREFHSVQSGNADKQSSKTQDQPPFIDKKDRPLTVRDMEYFTKAIQDTIREMTAEFVEALTESRRSEDLSDLGDE